MSERKIYPALKKEMKPTESDQENPEQFTDRNGFLVTKRVLPQIEFSEDKVKAYLVIPHPKITEGEAVFEGCLKAAKKAGVKNINEIAIKKTLISRTFGKQVLIAEGVAPQPGKDGYLAYRLGSKGGEKVFPGQLLATRVLAKEGKGGEKAAGGPIPPPPVKETKIIAGHGVVLSKDGLHAWSSMAGEVVWDGTIVSVEEVHHLKGPSLEKSGDFTGRLIVEEDIKKDISLSATSDIEVNGNVEAATLKSSSGIKVKGSITKARIEAKGDILADSVSESNVKTSSGNVVTKEIKNSRVEAGKKIVALGRKGIIGGSITAGEEINAQTVGDESGTVTQLTVGAGGKIAIKDSLHQGTTVTVGETQMEVNRTMKGISMGQSKEKEIAMWEYDPPRLRRTIIKPSSDGHTSTPAQLPPFIVLETSSLEEGRKQAARLLNLSLNEISWQEISKAAHMRDSKLLRIRFFPTTIPYKPWELEEEWRKKEGIEATGSKAVEAINGFYKLTNTEGGLFLIVFAPKGGGQPVSAAEVLSEIRQKEYANINLDLIKQTVREREGIPIRISYRQLYPERDGRISIELAPDMSWARATVYPPRGNEGTAVGVEDVIDALKQKGVVAGIKKEEIKDIFLSKEFRTPIMVAEAISPQPAAKDKIAYKVPTEPPPIKFAEDEYGRVNFKELNLIQNVSARQVLAILIRGNGGKPGKKINGEIIPPPPSPQPIDLPLGKNTKLSEDGNSILATIDGQVLFVNERLNVEPVYEVQGDVDTGVGNIRFVGAVMVGGNVPDDFEIEAGNDIYIQGTVEGAKLTAGGNITIGNGVRGRGKAKLQAKGNVSAKFIENSKVKAGGNVIVHNGILHSIVDSGGIVAMVGKKGIIIGGRVRAKKRISAIRLGNRLYTSTQIEVGENYQIREQLARLQKHLEKAKKDLRETKLGIAILNRIKGKTDNLPPKKQTVLIRMLTQANELTTLIHRYVQQRISLENQLDVYDQEDPERIDISNRIYPGVELTIRTETKVTQEAVNEPVTITLEGKKLRFGLYQGGTE